MARLGVCALLPRPPTEATGGRLGQLAPGRPWPLDAPRFLTGALDQKSAYMGKNEWEVVYRITSEG
jgi:hypothetical protein